MCAGTIAWRRLACWSPALLTLPIATQAVTPALLLPLLALAGAAGGATGPSRDMIVRGATPPGASGKVFGFVYSGLDVGSFLAPPVFGILMGAGHPATIFWIAVGLYVINAGLVMAIRQSTTPVPTARGAAPAQPARLPDVRRWSARSRHSRRFVGFLRDQPLVLGMSDLALQPDLLAL